MFLWRWCKKLIFLGILAAIAYAVSGYVNFHGRPVRQQAQEFFASSLWREGVKDMRTWVAAVLRLATDKVEEGIEPADQEKLKAVIEEDLEARINAIKSQPKSEGAQ